MFVARRKCVVSRSRAIASRLIAVLVAVSLVAIWAQIAGASSDQTSVMACCVGKEAGHCDSGLTAHKPPPPPEPEPMCGLTSLESITIVAEPSTHSHNSSRNAETQADAESKAGAESHSAETHADAESRVRAESPSLSKPCRMDCGACTASASRLQKRQKDIIQARTLRSSAPAAITRFENLSRLFLSNHSWTQINPRGPPATSL